MRQNAETEFESPPSDLSAARVQPSLWRDVRVPPLLPVLLPLVVAAVVTGVLFSWWFPATPPGATAPLFRFTDVTAESGLNLVIERAADAPTTLGSGVVTFDFDVDGFPDLLFVNGGPWPWEEGLAKRVSRGSLVLYRNDGTGRFSDVTALAGLNIEVQGMTATAGDFDNDGLPDIYVTCVGANHLFRNRGKGRFEDVTEAAGVAGSENTWSSAATWLDFDNDGRLDLIVGHYARWGGSLDLRAAFTVAAVGHSYGAPTGFVSMFPSVYRNTGDGRFELVPDGAGLRPIDRQTGFPIAKTIAVASLDVNADGKLDLLFSYHRAENALYVNRGDGTFRRWVAGSDQRQEGFAVGLASASSLPLTRTDGAEEQLVALMLTPPNHSGETGEQVVALDHKLGVALLDYDFDGRLDMFVTHARIEADLGRLPTSEALKGASKLLWNRGNAWIPAPDSGESQPWGSPSLARGAATEDFDGDGDMDLVVTQYSGSPRLWRNDQRYGPPWLRIELVGTRGARDAYGARVEVHTPSRVLTQTRAAGTAFMAQSGSSLTFGLGADTRVRKVVVHWPSGVRQELRQPGINRRLVITEPQ